MPKSVFDITRCKEEGYPYIETVPEIKQFLDTELFDSITLVKENVSARLALLEFEVIAPKIMPSPDTHLLNSNMVQPYNLLYSQKSEDGIKQSIGFYNHSLQIILNFKKPDTSPEKEQSTFST
ncbi:hypothetical protein KJ632_05705 [Patescibacteria group bacterium]|nr:hypothetical protein [Patescibacteria group bacterium]